jgi:small ubiquitin-related modifier
MADEGEDTKHINLKVKGQDNSTITFKVLKNAPLKKLMNVYCDRLGLNRRELRFLYDGSRIQDNDTPLTFQMEENDEIDVEKYADGGCN